jgi:hypothetical protein
MCRTVHKHKKRRIHTDKHHCGTPLCNFNNEEANNDGPNETKFTATSLMTTLIEPGGGNETRSIFDD